MTEFRQAQTPDDQVQVTTESPTTEAEGAETGKAATEPTVDWEEKFKASSREAQRLIDENKSLKEDTARYSGKLSELERNMKELEEVAKGNNPEGYDAARLRKHIEGLTSEISTMKERQELNDFIASNPDAAKFRDTLRDLGRAYPQKDYNAIWEQTLKPVASASSESDAKRAERKAAAPDRGGTTGEPRGDLICGYTPEKFNALPLEKRRELLKKHLPNAMM